MGEYQYKRWDIKKKETHTPQKGACYIRVSLKEQADNPEKSPASQEQLCSEYIEQRPWLKAYPVQIYTDVFSGGEANRVDYQLLLSEIKMGLIAFVVTTEIERVMRDVVNLAEFIKICNEYQVEVHFIRQDYDPSTPLGEVMILVGGLLGKIERDKIRQRTRDNMRARARRGLYNGGLIYGYKPRVAQKGYLDIDPEKSSIVRMLFEQCLEIGSYSKLASWANTHHIPPPNGKYWRPETVKRMLRNVAYIGKRWAQEELVQAVWEPIVSVELWEKVNIMLDQTRETRHNAFPSNAVWVFAGKLHCQYCNTILEVTGGKNHVGTYYTYYRHKKLERKHDCPIANYIPSNLLDIDLCHYISSLMLNEVVISETADKFSHLLCEQLTQAKERLISLNRQKNELEKEKEGIMHKIPLFSDEEIEKYLRPHLGKLSTEQEQLTCQIKELQLKISQLNNQVVTSEDIKLKIAPLLSNLVNLAPHQQQRVIQLVVNKIELTPKGITLYLKSGISKKEILPSCLCSSDLVIGYPAGT